MSIFLSYAREDERFVKELADGLRQFGFDVRYDESFYQGSVTDLVRQAIEGASTVVVMISQHSRESDWIRGEFLHAHNLAKRRDQNTPKIVVLQLDDTDPSGIHILLGDYSANRVRLAGQGVDAVVTAVVGRSAETSSMPPRPKIVALVLLAFALGMFAAVLVRNSIIDRPDQVSARNERLLLEHGVDQQVQGVHFEHIDVGALDDLVLAKAERDAIRPYANAYPKELLGEKGFLWHRDLPTNQSDWNATFHRITKILGILDTAAHARKKLYMERPEGGMKPYFASLAQLSSDARLWLFPSERQRSYVHLSIGGLAPGSEVRVSVTQDVGRYQSDDDKDFMNRRRQQIEDGLAVANENGCVSVCAVMGDTVRCRTTGGEVVFDIERILNVPGVREDHDGIIVSVEEARLP